MRLALIFNKENDATIGCYFERAAQALGVAYDHYWTRNAKEIPKRYDLYLRIDHGDYKYDLPDDLKPSAFYAIDTHLKKPYRKIREQARHYDYVFCAQKDGAQRLKRETGIDTFWVPIGCDPERHKALDVKKRLDVAFVGTEGKKNMRGVLLNAVARRYPESFIGKAHFSLMSNIYSSARIGFNYSINNDINMRMFEVMCCGTLLLTNRITANGFEELFCDGKNLVVYKDRADLFEKIDYYLAKEVERDAIARQGQRLVTGSCTYRDRLHRMLEVCGWR